MALIIGGHPRSGTSLLSRLCNSHPDITLTFELGCFNPLGKPYKVYKRKMFNRWWNKCIKRKQFFMTPKYDNVLTKFSGYARSHIFMARYIFKLHRYSQTRINYHIIENILKATLPKTGIIGDKYPGYVFSLDKLSKIDELSRLIIFRDCRDVVRSNIEKSQTSWRGTPFGEKLNTAEKIAKKWVLAIDLMEKYTDKLHIIRYENLVQYPDQELNLLGKWLNIDPAGFSKKRIRNTSIGKYKSGLSSKDLATVMKIAGQTMNRLGYKL